MFEDRTYENILVEMLAMAPSGIDTRQGSIYYDAVAPYAFKQAKFYSDLKLVFELIYIDTATGEYLDKKANEHGIYRLAAKACKRVFSYTGVIPSTGERFFANSIYFVLKIDEAGALYVEAEIAGEEPNYITTGEKLIPLNNIDGLLSSTLGDVLDPGTAIESDYDLRQRLREKISGPAENGNKHHYKVWCEEIAGIGRARIFPLWNGPNTVKGVLVDTQGLPASSLVVDEVQEYIDPGSLGLGEGVANLGAHFTAVAATPITINISYTAVLKAGSTVEDAQTQTQTALGEYLKDLALNTPEGEDIVIRVTSIGAIIYSLESILDYSNLTLNEATANIPIDIESVAVLGTVTVNV